MLTEDQKSSRLDISRNLLSSYEDDPEEFINQVVTQVTWVHHFDSKPKKKSMQWKHPGSSTPKKKVNRVSSAGKVMASIFWDNQGVIIADYFKEGRTINDT